jgi:hypothetical protein
VPDYLANLPKKITESGIIDKIKEIPEKFGESYSWIRSEETRPFIDALATLGSFAVGDPTGMVLPLILNCGDNFIRKRAEKHLPELAQILIIYKPQFNFDIVKSEFGQQILREIIDKIIHEENELKIHYLKSFLISVYLQPKEDYDLFRKYKDMLYQMDPVRLQILAVLSNPREFIPKIINAKIESYEKNKPREIGNFNIPEDYNNHHFQFNNLLFEQSISELKTQGILKNSGNNGIGLGGNQLSEKEAPKEQIGVVFQHSRKLAEQYEQSGLHFRKRTELQIEIATIDSITEFGWYFIQFFKIEKELSNKN